MRTEPLTAGLTIVEVLVGVFLLSVIAVVVLSPLTSFFGLTRKSSQQVSATQQAQQVVEAIRGDWLNVGNYDQRCATEPLPAGTTVTLHNLDLSGAEAATVTLNSTCTGHPPDPSPARRISVQVSVNGTASTLNVDVARP
ncbi:MULTISPECIES: hypothetical protein [Deinococcus]|uniref:Type II secretory pathway pseudopilin PulG n=2 Tax=Deinococcus soli (ex Cha et al. 2016) TaxID=1309411 RepID=A0ACC6KIL1_9DEIO|nr:MULTISPECIES: hypothetical protein [Deinococcus]MDR6219582.1 type II secretory pathway pseudopilin PulG [Deinococcus soli (ex Cha et al. 2016)]MDR6327261.1 type II secretory pathway pseudopilin PulG [Deinococcus soli (ex Cha et al. 2016)]MDR6752273.1 type II secretory pathway pseudopilin PulG [Deinococcus soli (ex Cha et al. 2016)]RIY07323.1 hypothetical protein D3W47_08470 [Deinococcus sp. RM]GGB63581.1 hypothetical protein GCM10008019_19500 [Deinococcus soli (ex Cha et al. 2016)]